MSIEKITKGNELAQSKDLIAENILKLKELFPEAFTEGKIDFTVLRDVLGDEVETEEEYYRFTWAGKAQARREAHKPSTGTLRPCKEESVDWETTKNIYIEGDNLEVLKLLQKSYTNKVKMIYIDPPYNTGKDFVYKDNYKDNLKNYQLVTGQVDSEGNRLSTNSESDGRYHSNWLNMMYPRLVLARNLLKKDGLIFLSIDDHESDNLRKLMNEIFGEENFISDITVVNNLKGRNDKKYIATANERLFLYIKSDEFQENGLSLPDDRLETYKHIDSSGKFRLIELRKRGGADTRVERPNMYYPIYVNPKTGEVSLEKSDIFNIEALPKKSNGVDGRWRWGLDTTKNNLRFLCGQPVHGADRYNIYEKDYLESEGEIKRIKPKSVMSGANYSTDVATKFYRNLMGSVDFTNPKPIELICDLINYSASSESDAIIMDFFAGSSTTAHAVLRLNSIDGGNRKFIMVQLPEATDKASEAFKLGFQNLADIGKERIRRASKQIAAEAPALAPNLDLGFKVFKLDSSNIKGWDGNPDDITSSLFDTQENIKPERTEEDVLFEILLKYGLDLTLPIEERTIEGKRVFNVGIGALFICLANSITSKVAEGIGAWKEELNPETCRVIFKDSGFTDVEKTNSVQTLKRFGIHEIKSI